MYLILVSSFLLLSASLVNSHGIDPEGKVLEKLVSDVERLEKSLQDVSNDFYTVHKARSFGSGSERLYVTNGNEGTFETLSHTCSQAGGHVPSPQLEGENKALAKVLERHNKAAYLVVQSSAKFTNWAKGEPDRADGTKPCVKADKSGVWFAASCEEENLVVCEFSFI